MSLDIALIGQIVQDTIIPVKGEEARDLGGVTYAVMALDALMNPDDHVVPMTRTGSDIIQGVRDALESVPSVMSQGIVEDPNPNNRVELRYTDEENREERVSGGVDSMQLNDLLPIDRHDGLLINLVSGRELEPATLSKFMSGSSIPVHLDLHSYLFDCNESGIHAWRRPDEWEDWLELCDILQLNRKELYTVMGAEGEIFDLGSQLWDSSRGSRLSCLLVTDGKRGSWGWYESGESTKRQCFIPPCLRGDCDRSNRKRRCVWCGVFSFLAERGEPRADQ